MTPTKEYQLSEFEQKVINNLDLIFDSFGIKYSERGDKYNFLCPIHGSTDITSACVYKSTGIALCFVGNCFNYNKNNLYGVQRLIGNLLNHYNIKKTVKEYCQDVFSGIKYDVKQNKPVEIKKKKQIIIPRSQLAGKTDGNIDFYLKRGFSQETIKKYDIFLCKKKEHLLYGRVVLPIYDDCYENAIGFVGRSLYPKCKLCKKHHLQTRGCATNSYQQMMDSKWLNSSGFSRNTTLFNFWFSQEEIKKSKEAILVESPGNCMKLAQAGILNVVAMFGTIFSSHQKSKLDSIGLSRLYLGLDNDKAGQEAAKKIEEQLKCECIPLLPPIKDYGEMNDEEIRCFLKQNCVRF